MRYAVRDEQIKKLQEVLLNSAWMIKDHLSNIFQIVIDGINDGEKDISFPFTMKNNRPNAPRMYIDLAERAVLDIYHYGNVPYAMPEMVNKYTDVTIVCKELRELGEYLRNSNDEDNLEQSNRTLIIHRYVSIASYTSAVLLRDYNKDLIDKDRELCEIIIFAFGYMFTQASDFEIVQAGNGIEAVIVGLILILDEDN